VDRQVVEGVKLAPEEVVQDDYATVSTTSRPGAGTDSPVVLYGARGFRAMRAAGLLSPWPSAAYRSWPFHWVAPLGLGICGLDVASVTLTLPVALRSFLTASASLREIFWMMADFLRPVPASGLPTFWAKKTSSVGLNLVSSVSLGGAPRGAGRPTRRWPRGRRGPWGSRR